MRKTITIAGIVLLLSLMFTMTVFATKPDYVLGWVDFGSVGSDGVDFWYDICDPVLVGQVVQPAVPSGKAAHGVFTSGNSPFCPYTTELEGTCQVTLISVETVGDPNSKPGRGVITRCTGDLEGLHGRVVVDEWYQYQAWYHQEP